MLEIFVSFAKAFVYEYGSFGLFLYSCIEVILFIPVPADIFISGSVAFGMTPYEAILFSVIGTTVGACIGYFLGRNLGEVFLQKVFSQKSIDQGILAYQKYGVFAVAIGALTPFPYVIIVWTAGVYRMNFFSFFFVSTLSRFLRFFLVAYFSGALFS
jgi:membrane protein YqaA with SNARE-associated domain